MPHPKRQKTIDVESDPVFAIALHELASQLEHVSGEQNAEPADDEIEVVSEKRIHTCPIGMTAVKTPVRGKDCKHPRCFDLANFLALVKQQKHWGCPLCAKDIHPPESLVFVEQEFVDSMLS